MGSSTTRLADVEWSALARGARPKHARINRDEASRCRMTNLRYVAKKKRCQKKRYATREEAQATICAMVEEYPSLVYKKAYRCATCKAWHVTSTPPFRRKRVQH
jgi:hypothetical protein